MNNINRMKDRMLSDDEIDEFAYNALQIRFINAIGININDVVNYSNEIVLFGQDDEYRIKLVELFPSDELDKLKYLQSLIDRLVVDNVGDVNSLNILLNLSKQDSSEDLLRKLNRHLSKNNKSATGAQLSFVLLCKVYNNS